MKEWEKAVEWREREIRKREKVGELEQATTGTRSERIRTLGTLQRVEVLEEEWKHVPLNLVGNVSTSSPGTNSWPITLLRSVVFRVLGNKTSSFLFCSYPPSSYPSSSSNPNSFTNTPSPSSSLPQRGPRCHWEARRDLYLSTDGQGSYLVLVGIGVCCYVEGACDEVGMWSWLVRRSRR